MADVFDVAKGAQAGIEQASASGISQGVELAKMADSHELQKQQVAKQKEELEKSKFDNAMGMMNTLARSNPKVGKMLAPKLKERFMQMGVPVDDAVLDMVGSEDEYKANVMRAAKLFTEKNLRDNPTAVQDIMRAFGNFGDFEGGMKQLLEAGKQQTAIEREEIKARRDETKDAKEQASVGQKEVDKKFAADYNEFTGGGLNKANDAISKLEDYKAKLEEESTKTFQAGGGPIAGSLPDAVRSQKSIALRDNIVSVANSALKATFGGNMSDSERKALANEFYNDKLDAGQNIAIIERKIDELKGGLENMKAKSQYFEKNKSTLAGFQPVSAGSSSPASNDMSNPDLIAQKQGFTPAQIENYKKTKAKMGKR